MYQPVECYLGFLGIPSDLPRAVSGTDERPDMAESVTGADERLG